MARIFCNFCHFFRKFFVRPYPHAAPLVPSACKFQVFLLLSPAFLRFSADLSLRARTQNKIRRQPLRHRGETPIGIRHTGAAASMRSGSARDTRIGKTLCRPVVGRVLRLQTQHLRQRQGGSFVQVVQIHDRRRLPRRRHSGGKGQDKGEQQGRYFHQRGGSWDCPHPTPPLPRGQSNSPSVKVLTTDSDFLSFSLETAPKLR